MYGLVVVSALAGLSAGAGPPGRPAWVLEVGLSAAQVGKQTETLQSRGYRPVCISAYNAVEANRFAVIYQRARRPAWKMDWGLAPEQFLPRARGLLAQGYVPLCLSGCNLLGAERLSDLWVQQRGPLRKLEYGLEGEGLLGQAAQMRSRGNRPVGLSSYMTNGANVYAVIWEKGSVAWELKYGLSAQGLQDALDDLSSRGYRPLSISGLEAGGVVRYSAVWEKRKGPAWEVRYGQSQPALLELARSMAARRYRPASVAGYNTLNGDRFASIWEKQPPAR